MAGLAVVAYRTCALGAVHTVGSGRQDASVGFIYRASAGRYAICYYNYIILDITEIGS